jgi:D-lactate dehydrogenase
VYFEPLLGPDTAVLAAGSPAVAVFVNDQVDADVIKQLAAGGCPTGASFFKDRCVLKRL